MKADKLFWGIILVYIGGIILLQNFDIIHFSWRYIWKLWPVILIISGVNILLSKSKSENSSLIIAIITILGLVLLTFFGLKSGSRQSSWGLTFNENFDGIDVNIDSNDNDVYLKEYAEEFDDSKYAKLEVVGGAGEFELEDTTAKLFEAKVDGKGLNYFLKTVKEDSTIYLKFKGKDKNKVTFPSDNFNKTKLYLNANPVWDIDLKIGAAELDFDLRKFKVKDINLAGGAGDFKIKLGSQYENVALKAETGISSIEIEVPENVGCRIINSSGLSSKSFKDFVEKDKGTYESVNYATATKHINIILKTGISDLKVKRYQE